MSEFRQKLLINRAAVQARLGILHEQIANARTDLARCDAAIATLDAFEAEVAQEKGAADGGS